MEPCDPTGVGPRLDINLRHSQMVTAGDISGPRCIFVIKKDSLHVKKKKKKRPVPNIMLGFIFQLKDL